MAKAPQAPQERVRFPGSDGPIQPIREEKLNVEAQNNTEEADEDSEDDEEEPPAPQYRREDVGARIGQELSERLDVGKVADDLDEEETVPLIFAKEVRLQDKGIMHVWGPGIHMVPLSIAGETSKKMHWSK